MILFLKTHVKGYTKKDGTYVAPHEDKRPQKFIRDWRLENGREAAPSPPLEGEQQEPGDTLTLYHGSYEHVREIHPRGMFGGVFASPSRGAAASHGEVVHRMEVPEDKILRQTALDYDIDHDRVDGALREAMPWLDEDDYDIAYKAVIEDRSHEVDNDDMMRVFRRGDWGEAAWEAQRIRGEVAALLGYQAVEMSDEHGKSYLVLPGVAIERDDGSERDDGGLGDTITVDGKPRPTRNSAGQSIHPTKEGIRNFWRWFGDSKVVDEQGRPLVVYHGTNSDLSAFASDRANYFTADPGAASVYAEGFRAPREGANVYPVYLSIQRPKWMPLTDSAKLTAADLAAIKEEGFDGVFGWVLDIRMGGPTPIAREVGTGQRGMDKIVTEAIPLSPEQIKSATGNRGTFDPSESSITKSHPAIQGASRAAAPADLNDGDARRNPGEPSREQAEAGRYNKPRVEWRGLTIAVENPAGSVRRGTNRDGQPWEIRMRYDYGEIVGSMGVDGDPVDVFLGPNLDAPMVYVVHQRKVNRWDQYDEDKCMVGFDSEEDAKAAFLSCYTDPRFLGPVTAMPVDEFVAKVRATRAKAAMIKAQQPIILFLKARDRHDTATGDLFGTHVESRTRKDGVVQTYHVSSPQPAIAVPALESAPGDKPVLFINHLQSKQSIGRDSKMSKDSPVETKQEDAVEEPAMPANAKLVTRDFVVKKVGRKWLTVTAPGKGYEMHLQLSPSTEHYKPGDAIKGIKVGEVREENRYGVKITYYVPNQRDLQRLEEAQAQEQDAKRKGEVERWLGYVEDKAKEGWLYENGLKKLAELGANADPAVKDRIEAARKQVASIKAARQQQYAQERREREAKRAETVSRRMLYPLWHMPPLNKPVRLGKEVVVFTGTGKPFRIDDSHPSMFGSHLLGHEGEKGAYAYYRPATPEEVAALEQREAEAKAAPPAERERHWAYSREAVDRALRGED